MHDGAILLTAGWLGDAWDLYFSQNASRAVSTLLSFGPVWLVRRAFGPSAGTYMVLGHVLYFAMALVPWLVLRAIEPHRLFSRLYLAVTLAMIYFLAEVVFGVAFWLMWLAVIVRPARTTAQIALATLLLGLAMAFCHPVTGLMTLVYLVAGGVLVGLRRPFPRHTLVAGAALAVLLLLAYFAQSRWLAATNPTILNAVSIIRFDYIDPDLDGGNDGDVPDAGRAVVAPAGAGLHCGRDAPVAPTVALIADLRAVVRSGRHGHADLALRPPHRGLHPGRGGRARPAAARGLARRRQRRVGALCPGRIGGVRVRTTSISCCSAASSIATPRQAGSMSIGSPWHGSREFGGQQRHALAFKWGAGQDYVRDMVVPTFDWYRLTLAFYTYFHSDRQRVLYHLVERPGDWKPYECPALARARALPHDATDLKFIDFLAEHYCPR